MTRKVLAGAAVSLRLRSASWDLGEQLLSSALTAGAASTVVLVYLAMDDQWDSLSFALGILACVGFAGCLLILLPRVGRRIACVVLIVLHFGGILSAVTSAPPPGSAPPWITQQLWARFYRPYLQFAYLNNAYHFYSPEPGPACLLWFYIKFDDGHGEWLKIPDRKDYATRQEYQRLLSVTEMSNQLIPQSMSEEDLREKAATRQREGLLHVPRIKPADWRVTPPLVQYREPQLFSKHMVASYARHVAVTYHSEEKPEANVKSVKVYRVVHNIVVASAMAEDWDQLNPIYYAPYYQGEFDPDGKLLTKPDDPFLYWLIPILYEPKEARNAQGFRAQLPAASKFNPDDYEIVDYCKLHAESD